MILQHKVRVLHAYNLYISIHMYTFNNYISETFLYLFTFFYSLLSLPIFWRLIRFIIRLNGKFVLFLGKNLKMIFFIFRYTFIHQYMHRFYLSRNWFYKERDDIYTYISFSCKILRCEFNVTEFLHMFTLLY